LVPPPLDVVLTVTDRKQAMAEHMLLTDIVGWTFTAAFDAVVELSGP